MLAVHGGSTAQKQPPKIARLGARLDVLDTANRMAFEAIYAADPLDVDTIRTAERQWDSTCAPLRAARNGYFACARRAAKRAIPIPTLPKDVSAARDVVQTARDADRAATRLYDALLELDIDLTSYRERADAGADCERKRFVFEALRDRFDGLVDKANARSVRDSERALTAQTRAFEYQQQRAMSAKRRAILQVKP